VIKSETFRPNCRSYYTKILTETDGTAVSLFPWPSHHSTVLLHQPTDGWPDWVDPLVYLVFYGRMKHRSIFSLCHPNALDTHMRESSTSLPTASQGILRDI